MAQLIELPKQPDGEGFYLHFSGGLRAGKITDTTWRLEPIFANETPCTTGPFSQTQIEEIAKDGGFRLVAFQSFSWRDGVHQSSWHPVLRGLTNHLDSPAGLWSRVAGNITRARTKAFFDTTPTPSKEELRTEMDSHDPVEALAQNISLSLRGMDMNVQQICDLYNEQLVNILRSKKVGHQYEHGSTYFSDMLATNVHSFFLQLGSVRDYFGMLIGRRVGLTQTHPKTGRESPDSMASLVNRLRIKELPKDGLLDLLIHRGDLTHESPSSQKLKQAGWLKEATDFRNELVHRRAFGSKLSESFGSVLIQREDAGLYRYFHKVEDKTGPEQDILDLVLHHYFHCSELMLQAAELSGYSTEAMTIADDDIISIERVSLE